VDKPHLLFRIAEASLEHPEELVKHVVYPVVARKPCRMSLKNTNPMVPRIGSRSTLSCEHLVHHYRRMVPQILDTLEFRSNNDIRPVISALELLKVPR